MNIKQLGSDILEHVSKATGEKGESTDSSYGHRLQRQNKFTPDNRMNDTVLAYKHHVERISKALEDTGGAFYFVQQAYKAMNPGPIGTGRIIAPHAPFGPPPGADGFLTDSADVPVVGSSQRANNARLQSNIKGADIRASLEKIQAENNLYTDKETALEYFYFSEDDDLNTKVETRMNVNQDVIDLDSIFETKSTGPDFGNGSFGKGFSKPKSSSKKRLTEKMIQARASLQNDDVFFSKEDAEFGYVLESNVPEGNYLPFFFQDLRSNRRIYFRAFFKSLVENITPSWTQETFFGRVEPVGIYGSTSRSISMNFSVAAMSKEGFSAMWRKMNAFSKLVYPTYKEGAMSKAPVCRLRIGDVVCDKDGNGLTGYISSPIELNYMEAPWEVEKWLGFDAVRELGAAPMMITVGLTFQVVHEVSPQIDENYNFDTSFFRRIGGLQESDQTNSSETVQGEGQTVSSGGDIEEQ